VSSPSPLHHSLAVPLLGRRQTLRHLAYAAPLVLLWEAGCGIRVRQPGDFSASGSGATPAAEREAPRIAVEDAYVEVVAGRAVIVDVRGPIGYGLRHPPGALLLAVDEIESDPVAAARRLPAGKRPILYCT
jgi:hypothetical protein